MATYNDLELDHYYLVQETETAEIMLVQPVMATSQCLLILQIDEVEMTFWRKKVTPVFEIVEELNEEQVAEYESLFEDDNDYEDWETEETDYELEGDEEFEEEEDEKLNNKEE